MKIIFKTYILLVYLIFISIIISSWNSFDQVQFLTVLGLVIITKLINLDFLKDLYSNTIYVIVLPFVVPAFVFLDTFYAILFISSFMYMHGLKVPIYKRFFNTSSFSISIYLASSILKSMFPILNDELIFSASFLLVVLLSSFIFSITNKIIISLVISLEKNKVFDINIFIGSILATKTALITIFLGLINVVLFYYTNLIGVAIFTFVIYFLKPALTYRHIFDNELSTYTNFVLHMLKQMDPITHQHSERVKFWTVMLAKKMKLPSSEIRQLSQAASWHDIGKIEVPFDILNKPGRLTDEEYNIIKHHPEAGYQLVKDVHFFKKFLPVIRHHHEKVDGTGYPHGLVGDKIPLHARIMAITDAFDAMTFDRSYRKAMSMAEAVEELKKYAGKQFDANVVAIFIEALQDEYGQEFEDFDEKVIMNVS